MTVFNILLLCAALISAPAMSAQAAEQISGNEVSYEDIVQDSEDPQQDPEDQEILSPISDNNISDYSFDPKELESESYIYYSGDSSSVIMPLADYDTYYGSISSTYLEYMRGYLSKLSPDEHYVGARVSQNEYIFAFGDLEYNNKNFSGQNIRVITWNTQNNGTFNSSIQSSFSLDSGSYLVYTDLGFDYPALASSSDISLRQIVYFISILVTFYITGQFFVRKAIRVRSKRWRV